MNQEQAQNLISKLTYMSESDMKAFLIDLIMGLSQEKQCALWKELQDCGIIKK